MEENKITFEYRAAIMQEAMTKAIEILVNAHLASKVESNGEGICIMRPTMSNGQQYFLKFCRLEDATLKDIKLANKLDKPKGIRSVPISEEQKEKDALQKSREALTSSPNFSNLPIGERHFVPTGNRFNPIFTRTVFGADEDL